MEGAKVYVQTDDLWQKATVVAALGSGRYRVQPEAWEGSSDSQKYNVIEVDASKLEDGTLPFQNANMPENGFPNMTTLDHLHEAALLHNLRVRFFHGNCPYTYTADIVIAVNPYRWYPDLYTEEKRKEYLVFDKAKLPPHAYAASSASYLGLQETRMDQSILVSGESGAGKTETVKILMAHLALIASSDDPSHIRRIVESNPLLESFGNAQTVRNDNSSRFGKFIELQVNSGFRLVGSKCRTYLLEKSRVVGQDKGERNYHIFYQMLAMDEQTRASFGLGKATRTRDEMRYTCMGASKTNTIEGLSDAERFKGTVAALALVGVEGEVLQRMLRALAGVLLLGQLSFEDGPGDDAGAILSSGCAADAGDAAAAFEVDADSLGASLTKRTMKLRGETIIKPLTVSDAEATRDALAKELYSRVFDWLVGRICEATTAASSECKHFVGLLDIFGFESFAINRFEQLCINYANEKLQQKFTQDVFKAVQEEYKSEGIPVNRIEFKDNAHVLALIESKLGIIAMLNEECIRPKGSDANFVSKLVSVHKADAAFSVPKLGAQKELQFSIRHYADSVMYTTTGWLERNKDTISDDVTQLMNQSSNLLVSSLFPVQKDSETSTAKAGANTVVTKFRNSLAQLMDTIGQTSTQYVRCIKPNKNKSPAEVDNIMVVEQLRCAGVIEAIRLSRAGFPSRMPLDECAQRFAPLARAAFGVGFGARVMSARDTNAADARGALSAIKGNDKAAACKVVVGTLVKSENGVQQYEVGRTRVYFKSGILESLEEQRALFQQRAAVEIVRCVRGRQLRKAYECKRWLAFRLQSLARMNRQRKLYLRQLEIIISCQAHRRRVLAKRRYILRRRERRATQIQAFWRQRKAMATLARARAAVVRIQATARRVTCRRRYLSDLKEFKEQAKLENQVKMLQAKLAAAERASSDGDKSSSVIASSPAEPPAELLETLNSLTAENAKLRAENEKQRAEIEMLRKENQQLRTEESRKGDVLDSIKRSKKQASEKSSEKRPPIPEDAVSPLRPRLSISDDRDDCTSIAESGCDDIGRLSSTKAEKGAPQTLHLFEPLSEFWEDVPCPVLPLMRTGAEVHLKFGANILYTDDSTKNICWKRWLTTSQGYRHAMAFIIEKFVPKDSSNSSDVHANGDCTLGSVFVLKSALSGRYVQVGGVLQQYCVLAKASKPEDATAFVFVPLADAPAPVLTSPGKKAASRQLGNAAGYACALRAYSGKTMLKLNKDGTVSTAAVHDVEKDLRLDRMAVVFEQLLPRTSYEICVQEEQIGLVLGKEQPARVLGFRQVTVADGSSRGAGAAERSGRVHIGDVLTSVNGKDVSSSPIASIVSLLAGPRPVTIGLSVARAGVAPGSNGAGSASAASGSKEVRRDSAKSTMFSLGKWATKSKNDSLKNGRAQVCTKGMNKEDTVDI
eukprot:TRINITY_DN23142_c0_g1_i1.p1 TRINITY_DN23142_c0_g1~~TRINITY_DN23142_c0_g1_i1.p1  ORF type:complete len:1423 (-),score=232.39 TRINITY_DN23142_c0_g1_i1:56-4324(-)